MSTRVLKPLLALLVALAIGLVGGILLGRSGEQAQTPADNSVAAGFARDMQTHHDQAVEMSWIVRSRTKDPAVRSLAYDIARTQESQSGQMAGWLQVWGLPPTGPGEQMEWMRLTGHQHDRGEMVEKDGRMKGMASEEELEKLRGLRGEEAEILYLQLMIDHHLGGVPMARAVLDCGVGPVEDLADAIITSQRAEVGTMTRMLEERGAKPRPDST
ncbi:DUF305 domain-containing protein [Janibacter corallicola]|uniref:DUF305 domain-containing protein n=1 Tax=Janibacter corallicola TaxID=415212 RepID=UPI000A4A1525|nr:DUF305 domain-containing protein [Janibacter corallicola]